MAAEGLHAMRGRRHRPEIRWAARVGVLALVIACAIQLSGCCTLIGLGVGAATDYGKPHGKIPPAQWSKVPQGTDVDVVLVDGFRVGGDFVRVSHSGSDTAAVVLEDDRGSQSVPVSEIRKINYGHGHRGKVNGAVLGLVLDALLIPFYMGLMIAAGGG
jgi:hypothetical protein